MDSFLDDYLQGKHPIEQKKWELPTDDELDRDEALFDALLASRQSSPKASGGSPLLRRGRGRLFWSIAAVLIAVVALFTWWNFKPQQPTQLAEKTEKPVELKDTPKVIEKDNVDESQTKHVKLANLTREVDEVSVPRSKATRVKPAEEPQPQTEAVVLASAADSLYYYLTQLENQMGDCRDSSCLAELTGLMRADERIKDLVNKIINKQVETAYQEEYLVDTTTRYIPL
ncbi:MAG: hypothetical protein IJK51_09490 [Bacteroidaceae bacterium]|nr:hypothetical protein [Bacteroidaceae bacterium]